MSAPERVAAAEPCVVESFDRKGGELAKTIEIDGVRFTSRLSASSDTGDPRGDWWKTLFNGSRPAADEQRGTLRAMDLFCGPGGLAYGFSTAARELGFNFVSEAAIDEDASAVKVYAANHDSRRRIVDSVASLVDYQVRGKADRSRFLYEPEVVDESLKPLKGKVDVILAGPPCQGHSNLNNHTRRADPRNELYLTVPAMAVALEAELVVIENVPGVLHDRGNVVEVTKALLESAGFVVQGGVLSADRLGWPQTRQRYFLIASRSGQMLDVKAVESALSDEKPRSLWWAIEDLESKESDGLMFPSVQLSEENLQRIAWLFEKNKHDLPPSERPECHREGTTYGAVYGRLFKDKPAPTITSGFMTPGRGRYVHPTQRRTLTPGEASRIQGFPDTYNFSPNPERPASKVQLTKWIGDAVPLPLGHAVGLCALGLFKANN